jgi:CHAT domain-containing protein
MGMLRWLAAALVLATLSSALAAQNPDSLDSRIRQARALQDKGSLQQARSLYEALLPALRARQPSSQLASVLNALSEIASSGGDYDGAVRLAQEAAAVSGRVGDLSGEARALNRKGIAEIERGGYADAQTDLDRALLLAQRAADAEGEIRVLNNLGSANYFRGMYLEALRHYQAAMDRVDRSANQSWHPYWRQITNFNEATLYQRLGQYEHALQIYKEVAAFSKGLSTGDRAHLEANLGTLYRRLGDPWKALASYESALGHYAGAHDADGEIAVLKNLGIVYGLDLANLPDARSRFERALALATGTGNQREQMQAHLYLGEVALRSNLPAGALTEFEAALNAAQALGTKEEQWKAWYGLGRARQLQGDLPAAESNYREALAVIEASRAQLQLSSLRAEFLADKRDVYDALIALLLQKNDASSAFSLLERSRARTFQDRLAQSDKNNQAASPLTAEEVRRHLDESSLLLEFWAAGSQIAVIWCTQSTCGQGRRQVSEADQLRMRTFLQKLPGNLHDNWREQFHLLDPLLPENAVPRASKIRHLLIVPDGWLSAVPFDLLHPHPNTDELLIERFDITYLPTAALLRRGPISASRFHPPWIIELVAFGDPQSSNARANSDDLTSTPALQELAYSAEEVRAVAGMTRGKSEIFLGPRNLKSVFLGGKANDAFLLHVSTHAFADADNPESSRMLFSPAAPNQPSDSVFLRELYDLDLRQVRLATISACDTERGKIVRGEGVQAFSRALLAAGARSSLTTLWRVDDEATAEFMRQFYFLALTRQQPTAEALRQAKLKFLRSPTLQNPRYWAAFVLNGDGQTPSPRIISWKEFGIGLTLSGVILAAGVVRLRRGRRLHRQHHT